MANLADSINRWFAVIPRRTVVIVLLVFLGDLLTVGGSSLYWLFLLAALASFGGYLYRGWRAALLLGCLPLLIGQYADFRIAAAKKADIASCCDRKIVVIGKVTDSWKTKNGRDCCLLQVSSIASADSPAQRRSVQGLVLLTVTAGGAMCSAQELMVAGRLRLPRRASHPWDFDERSYMQRRGVTACINADLRSLKIVHADEIRGPHRMIAAVADQIQNLRARMCALHRSALGAEDGDLLASMVIGDRAVRVTSEISGAFRRLGLSHILAASGFNLTVVIASVWWLLRWFWRSPAFLNTACLLSLVFFVALAGLSPSVQRAAIMCSIVLFSRYFHRSVYLPATLALALLFTIVLDPKSILDVGLQLSYAATAGLVAGAGNLSSEIGRRCSRLPAWICETLAVVITAQLSVLPLQLYYFWQIGLFFLPANLMVSPLVPVITIGGFASSALSMIELPLSQMLAHWLDQLVAYPLRLMIAAVHWLAQFDWSRMNTGAPALWVVALYYVSLACWFAVLARGQDIVSAVETAGADRNLAACAEPVNSASAKFLLLSSMVLISATIILFWRSSLPVLTVVCFPQGCVLIDGQRQAFVLGRVNEVARERLLAFAAAHLCSASRLQLSLQEREGMILAQHVPSNSTIMLAGKTDTAIFLSDRRSYYCSITAGRARFGTADKFVERKIQQSLILTRDSGSADWRPSNELLLFPGRCN